jgi:NitT/TauT family transport system ATP-binding protein
VDIILEKINKSYGTLEVLRDISFAVKQAEVCAILGPSGCGKTTLLNIISGMDGDYSGEVRGVHPKRTSYLFQEPRLLPWKTVLGNLEFIKPEETDTSSWMRTIRHYLELVGLEEFNAYYPNALSGGMRQRVAVVRAFIFPADLVLMDEPFQALDLRIKLSLVSVFKALWQESRKTALFVTHDVQEAMLLGDRIIVLSDRPSRVSKTITNPAPPEERSLGNEQMLKLERDLYTLVT